MNVDPLLTKLQSEGIVRVDDAEEFELTDSYLTSVESYETGCPPGEEDRVGGMDSRAEHVVDTLTDRSPTLLAFFRGLQEAATELQLDEQIQALHVLPQIRRGAPPSDGSPQAFFPLYIEQLLGLVPLHNRSIVYIWRRDCQPCDTMKAELNTMFEPPPDDIALLSQYGPDGSVQLTTEFNVQGGPALLFFADGEVDTRLYGAQYRSVIREEVNKLRELT